MGATGFSAGPVGFFNHICVKNQDNLSAVTEAPRGRSTHISRLIEAQPPSA